MANHKNVTRESLLQTIDVADIFIPDMTDFNNYLDRIPEKFYYIIEKVCLYARYILGDKRVLFLTKYEDSPDYFILIIRQEFYPENSEVLNNDIYKIIQYSSRLYSGVSTPSRILIDTDYGDIEIFIKDNKQYYCLPVGDNLYVPNELNKKIQRIIDIAEEDIEKRKRGEH